MELSPEHIQRTLSVGGREFRYYAVDAVDHLSGGICMPRTIRILLENQLRHFDGGAVREESLGFLAGYSARSVGAEILFWPSRVLMQEAAGLPGMLDLASMRDLLSKYGYDPKVVNPHIPVDLVIDHSVMVDHFGSEEAYQLNLDLEYKRNEERYSFLKWAQRSFRNFRVVPPGQGICHQINLEHLATVVACDDNEDVPLVFPDTVIGTDSHTTMVNALSVLGWGVGAIEGEIAMMGEPLSMLLPHVVGVEVIGSLPAGSTVTDAVLTLTEMLRKRGVVGRFVEFFGPGLTGLKLADRATLANMAPDYGATCGYFPIDEETLRYLRETGRSDEHIDLVEAYARAQGLWYDSSMPIPNFSEILTFDLSSVEPSVSGPGRPEQRISLSEVAEQFARYKDAWPSEAQPSGDEAPANGAVVIAAITSCANTSNPSAMIGAGLLARNAVRLGLSAKPWVKTSMSPGSRVVVDYLRAAGLEEPLRKLGFDTVGFGCMTCVGNSGPLPEAVARLIEHQQLHAVSVLSGNRNFEARIHRLVRSNYLCSPALVVAYALAGNVSVDLLTQPIGTAEDGTNVYLRDVWPDPDEVEAISRDHIVSGLFTDSYDSVFDGGARWKQLDCPEGDTFSWYEGSDYIRMPPFVEHGILPPSLDDLRSARVLAILGDQVTTDHISPVGEITCGSPAGQFLQNRGVPPDEFNSYASRRANYEVMTRGTFANPRLKNEMVPQSMGSFTRIFPGADIFSIYDAATELQRQSVPSVIFAGKQYGTGSARDWAARGTYLLGVRAVVAESFERIHRSNLALMGVLPVELPAGVTRGSLMLSGDETIDIIGVSETMSTPANVVLRITRKDGQVLEQPAICRLDTRMEKNYFRAGGVLKYIYELMLEQGKSPAVAEN
ncbi:aconitate hydratase AcnA [Pusillimonas caeni]|uniref:aconitate hydratase AcnA n=1 Tax=Pusillimonas caeni TaxID=1348472 RepID=UPI000E59E253|nr:aconitate hydratase AcnA [Pusillimonas caeni]TFL15796.1 aconitate hydratase AcnA [Pusillimonas caeni]